jgi:hypothetical protein
MPTAWANALMIRGFYGAVGIACGTSAVALGGKSHRSCPIIKPAVLIAVYSIFIIELAIIPAALATAYIVVKIFSHPNLVANLRGSIIRYIVAFISFPVNAGVTAANAVV